jgi:hypothetical protein
MRRRILIALEIGLLATLFGCSSNVPEPKPTDLHSQLGHEVSFEAQYGGPGKEADWVMLQGEEVYLIDPVFNANRRPDYGANIQVQGILRYRTFPINKDPLMQTPPDYFYIDHASVRILPPANGQS